MSKNHWIVKLRSSPLSFGKPQTSGGGTGGKESHFSKFFPSALVSPSKTSLHFKNTLHNFSYFTKTLVNWSKFHTYLDNIQIQRLHIHSLHHQFRKQRFFDLGSNQTLSPCSYIPPKKYKWNDVLFWDVAFLFNLVLALAMCSWLAEVMVSRHLKSRY